MDEEIFMIKEKMRNSIIPEVEFCGHNCADSCFSMRKRMILNYII